MATLLSDYYGLRTKHCTELGQLGPITENIDFHLMQSVTHLNLVCFSKSLS